MGNYRMCWFFIRRFKAVEAGPPEDVKEAFKKCTGGGTHMTADQLQRFLVGVQGEVGVSVDDAKRVLEMVLHKRHHITRFARQSLNLDDFYHFLFSSDLNPPISDHVHQDMTKPLSHYFIFTGHNSYLTGNQLSSACSDAPIIKALQRGVRVIELDLWPNSRKDNVHVLHGRTLTSPVDLIRCLRSIKEHAFKSSPYPVIITIEDHLTPQLQAKVAEMIKEIFGDMLYVPKCECLEEFPSPEDLKYKIIISTKPPKEYLKTKDSSTGRKQSQKAKDLEDSISEKEPSDNSSGRGDDDRERYNEETSEDSNDESPKVQAVAYKRLIAIHAGGPKGGLKKALVSEPSKVRRLSLREQALEKAIENHSTDVIRFTQKNVLRVYPKGSRVTSSNYKPLIGWMHGVQMIAFNMQGYGKPLWLMHGMFRSNGGCGYVRKPDFLMKVGPHGKVFNPKTKLPVRKTLKVKVYMGDGWNLDFKPTHFDKYSPPDFYVKVGIAGVPCDKAKMKRTRAIEDNWTPVWCEEFTFPLTVPELALLRIEVHEYDMSEKDDFGGQTCLPVSELRKGIRAVPLYDHKGRKYTSVRLLMRFDFC